MPATKLAAFERELQAQNKERAFIAKIVEDDMLADWDQSHASQERQAPELREYLYVRLSLRQNGSPDELFLLQMALFKENMEEWRQRPAVKEWLAAGLAAAAKQRRPLSTAA